MVIYQGVLMSIQDMIEYDKNKLYLYISILKCYGKDLLWNDCNLIPVRESSITLYTKALHHLYVVGI